MRREWSERGRESRERVKEGELGREKGRIV
jgi:hypothetical protein